MPQNFIIGNLTRVYLGILADETFALDEPTAPPDSLATLSAAASKGATSLAVTALEDPIPAGTVLPFYTPADAIEVELTASANKGATSLAVTALSGPILKNAKIIFKDTSVTATVSSAAIATATNLSIKKLEGDLANNAVGYYFKSGAAKLAYTTASSNTGDAAIAVRELDEAIGNAAIALHKGLLLLQGGTNAEEQISADDTESTVFGEDLSYASGVVTSQSWEVSYDFNVLPSDQGYYRLVYAAQNALAGIRAWVKKQDQAPAGYASGEAIEGLVQITDFSKSNSADGIIEGSCTFTGRGTPTTTPARK